MFYIVIGIGLIFAYISGVHDGGTIIATTVSSRLVSPEKASLLAGASNFLGAILMGTAVAYTISSTMVNSQVILAASPKTTYLFVISTFAGCIFWNIFTWIIKLPSSSSNALIGSMIGACIAGFGTGNVYWNNILVKVVLAMIISPIIGFAFGYIFLKLEHMILKTADMKVKPVVTALHKISTVLLALSYGSNDSQKVMGLIAIGLATNTGSPIQIPWWLIIICPAALALGTITGGHNMITTVGKNITKINLDNSFSSQLASIFVVFFANVTGLPISTTQVVTASVMGVGTENTPKSVNWSITKNILIAWIFTLPASALCGMGIYKVLSLIVL